jgi:DNA-binding GntR family transcriptional regulator
MIQMKSSRAVIRTGVNAAEAMHIFPRQEKETGVAYAYRILEYNILMLIIPPGAWVRESCIAKRLGLSKTPVHQAVGLLHDHMLVDVKAQSATHVSYIDLNALRQGLFLRLTIEPAVILRVIGTMPTEDLTRLATNIKGQREAIANKPDPYKFIHLDDEFHHIIYQAANKELVWESIRKGTTHFDRVRYMGLIFGYEDPDISEHEELYKMLAIGHDISERTIRDFIAHHLYHYTAYFDRMTNSHSDYFVLNGLSNGTPAIPLSLATE